MKYLYKYKQYAPLILRIGLALVFLWFGITQVINPESFAGYLPSPLSPHSVQMVHEHAFQWAHNLPVQQRIIIIANGLFEIVLGTFLILGLFTQISALLLSIHLIIISISLGYNDLAIRDMGLAIAVFSVFLHGPDKWSLESNIRKKHPEKNIEGDVQ